MGVECTTSLRGSRAGKHDVDESRKAQHKGRWSQNHNITLVEKLSGGAENWGRIVD